MVINKSCGITDFLNINNCDNFATKHAWGILYPTSGIRVKSIPVIQFIVGNKCVFLFMEHFNLIYNAIIAYYLTIHE